MSDRLVVLVTDPLSDEGLDILNAEPAFEVRVRTGLSPEALLTEVAQAHALLVRSGTKVTAEVLEAGKNLRVVGRAGTGVDNVDVPEATRRGVVVMNTPGGNSVAACEHTFALLLALLRNIGPASGELAKGVWNRKHMGRQLEGRTLGILGFGRIGREVAVRARAFGMTVIVADPLATESLVREWEARLVELDTLLETADIVSLHLPLTDDTRHLIGAEALSRMKPHAVLVNCARGGLVDEAALAKALDAGTISGAAIDVFEREPETESPLFHHPKALCTPHLGASTEEAQRTVAAQICEQVREFLLRGEVQHAVNMPSLSAEVYALVRPYLDLGERLGSLAAQVSGDPPSRVEICFRGDCRELPRGPVISAVLVGILGTRAKGGVVNYVNARSAASELGIEVEERATEKTGDHVGLLEVAVTGSHRRTVVAGNLNSMGRPRLAHWEGLSLDAPATGNILVLRNPDVPGVVGFIGTLLGDAGLNIAHIAWGRDRDSKEAFTFINLDAPVPEDLLAGMQAHEKILWAAAAVLPPSVG